jgi:ubiquinone biosynthesis accessory factor UbiK
MMQAKLLDDIAREVGQRLPRGLEQARQDIEKAVGVALEGTLSRMGLVTREEFEVQSAVLARTREKLAALEQTLARLEAERARL